MEDYLAPAVLVAIIGMIFQGIKALIDIIDNIKNRKITKRQERISLYGALIELLKNSGLTDGEIYSTKLELIDQLLSDSLPDDLLTKLK